MHSTLRRLALAVLLPAALAAPAHAGNQPWGFQLWAATPSVAPLSETDQNPGGVRTAIKASNEMGYQFGAEFRSGLVGVAFDYLHARHDIEQSNTGLLGAADFDPVSVTLALHLPTPALELSAGPTVSYVNWGDLDLSTGGKQAIDAKLGYGVSLGADLPLGRSLAITGGMRWLKLKAEPKGGTAVDVDPLISRVGLALRF